ncbi:MAG: hypothetical protein ACREHD_31935 [Pirellulales bacterium]
MSALDDLLLARRLNGIAFGMCKDEVVGAIGQPEDRLLQKSPEVLKYGSLELGFIRPVRNVSSRLATISLYFGRGDKLPDWLDPVEWPISEITTIDQFRKYLEAIGLRVHSSATAEPNEYLITETGVRASFVNGQLRLIHAADVSQAPIDRAAKSTALEASAKHDDVRET